ncbi:hypothetical protein ACDQ55_01120 [Chitinophaga sp. 30R24]|uniref:hypothetical protein n=1 Tax=Chitinophaga sp. 30R24 TaxID=3248838 RepID=UPI003B8EEDAC
MELKHLIGKRITNIYGIIAYENYGLDRGECFIELDNSIIVDIPSGKTPHIWEKELEKEAVTIIPDLTDETATNNGTISISRKSRYIKNRKITNILWYPDMTYDSGFLLLDNGCIIGETRAAMNGTGLVGLNYYYNLEDLKKRKGANLSSLIPQS